MDRFKRKSNKQGGGYQTSSDTICANCFDDPGVVRFIGDHLEFKTCSLCKRTSEENIAASADKVLQFFLQKIYEHHEDGMTVRPTMVAKADRRKNTTGRESDQNRRNNHVFYFGDHRLRNVGSLEGFLQVRVGRGSCLLA